jgi:pyrroline-5-carboxylate reductase
MIILATRSQNIREIVKYQAMKDYLMLSFIAALHLTVLSSYFDCRISKTMCIGPETISGRRDICVINSKNDTALNGSIFVV